MTVAGGVCSRDGEKSGEEGEVLAALGRVTVINLELIVRCICQFPQVCWKPTTLEIARGCHYVLFHEMSVFLENKEILNLAMSG